MLMTIGLRRRFYQDLLVRTMGVAEYDIVMNHTCIFSYHDPPPPLRTQICARFYVGLIKEGRSLWRQDTPG